MNTAAALVRLTLWYAAVLFITALLSAAYCYAFTPAVLKHIPTDHTSLAISAAITLAVSLLLALFDLHEERADQRKRGYR